ncbi:MAG: glycosyltransferase [Hyphomonadaceae bacterium]
MAVERHSKSGFVVARQVWRAIAPVNLRRVTQPLAMWARLQQVERAIASGEHAHRPGPLIVSGLGSGSKGISEGMRLTLAGLLFAGFAPIVDDLRPQFGKRSGSWPPLVPEREGGVWIIHLNPPEMAYALSEIPSASWLGRYRIGYWAYELERVLPAWVRAANYLHEIWTPSRFVAEALIRSGVKIPVRVMPHPVALGAGATRAVEAPSQLDGKLFQVLALGDIASSLSRKNLIGAIAAYVRAFQSTDVARLIIKTSKPEAHSRLLDVIRKAAAQRPDISVISDDLSATEMKQLIASSSVLLSLHRAEGFGLALAEAFLADVPALATGWSGNLEFMDQTPELLVQCSLVPVRDSAGVYRSRDLSWAEPDIDDAARKLRDLAGAPELRLQLARRGRTAVEALSQAWRRDVLMATPLAAYVDQH